MHAINRKTIWILFSLIAVCTLQSGCSYYQVKELAVNKSELKKENHDKMYVILHHKNSIWHLQYVNLIDSINGLTARVLPLSKFHKSYLTTRYKRGNRIKKWTGASPINELHIYASSYDEVKDQIIIPISSIEKIEIYTTDSPSPIRGIAIPLVVISGLTFLLLHISGFYYY